MQSIDSETYITNGSVSDNSATMLVRGALITKTDLTNYGMITVQSFMRSEGDVVNKGILSIEEGSTADNFDGSGGELILTSTSEVNSIYTLLDVNTNATVDADTSITVNASARTLSKAGTQNDVVLIESSGLTSTGFDAGNSISSGSILLRLSDAKISGNNITADLEVLSAGNILNVSASSVDIANLANDFQDMNTAGQQVIESVYGSLVDNSASSAEMSEYLDEIRPDDSGSAAIAASDASTAAMGNIMNRGANLRGVNFGDMQAAGGVWLQALYGKARQDAKDGNLGYDSDLGGFTLGLDSEQDNRTRGIAFSYGKSDIKFPSRSQKDEVESYIGTFYNFWRMDRMYVDTSLSLGGSTHKGSRLSGAANMTSDYGSTQMGAQALVGFYMPRGDLMVEPMASLRLNLVNVDGYTASNSEGNLTEVVDDVSYRRFDAGLGVAVSKRWETGQGTMTPRASLMAYRDFVGDTMDNQVTFAGNDYVIEGASAEKNSYEMRLGMDMTRGENTTFTVGYTRVQKSDFSSDNFDFRVRYDF